MTNPQYILSQVCTHWVVIDGFITRLGGSMDNYTYYTVIQKEEFDLFNWWELKLCHQYFIDIKNHYAITTVMVYWISVKVYSCEF